MGGQTALNLAKALAEVIQKAFNISQGRCSIAWSFLALPVTSSCTSAVGLPVRSGLAARNLG